ncbi:MAG: hypothetical protein AB8B59_17150 [Maribacter sp.]
MKRFLLLLFTLSLLASVNSCNKDDGPNFHFAPLRITSAELPDAFELNQTYQITVTYDIPDGCTSYSGFDVTDSDTTVRNVVVFGTVRTDLDGCTLALTEGQASFNFICLYNQPYVFRFWQADANSEEEEYFEVVVPVN